MTLDIIDRQIVELLQQDGSLSVSNLADRLGMTPPPCWRRVKSLRDRGILTGQYWEVDPSKIGLDLFIYATVKLAAHDPVAVSAFKDTVRSIPEVLECYVLLGGIDVLLKIAAPSIGYYETFFYESLSRLPAVREITSSVVMSEVKKTRSLPFVATPGV